MAAAKALACGDGAAHRLAPSYARLRSCAAAQGDSAHHEHFTPAQVMKRTKPAPKPKRPASLEAAPAVNAIPLPFYRRPDWLAGAVTLVATLVGYLLTLAPNVTLEDSGEMSVAAMYAGVPHAPGYPVWTVYAWGFTKLLPFSNIAWRVAVSSAVAAALACGLIALMVSRASRLLLAGIPALVSLEERWQKALGVVSGFVAGACVGFSGFVWSQAVIVEVYALALLSLTGVMACLFRWMHGPEQRRYLYLAWFLFGICLTNHQSLIVAVLAIELCIVLTDARLGRDLLLGNALCYALGLFLIPRGANGPLFVCFHAIGLGSVTALAWLAFKTWGLGKLFHRALACAGAFAGGVALYFLMPVFSMANPPMNWAYPRTVEGFLHALSRGQYEKPNPVTDLFQYAQQLWQLLLGAVDEFNAVYLVLALLPLVWLKRLARRDRAWVIGGLAFYLTLGPGLLVLLNPGFDRSMQSLVRVFFAASHVLVGMAVGLGATLAVAWVLARREGVRRWALAATGAAVAAAVAALLITWSATELALARQTAVFGVGLALLAGILAVVAHRHFARVALAGALCLLPVYSVLSHWWDNEQRGHLFGYWYGHDMFSPPFKGADGQLTYTRAQRTKSLAGPEGRFVYPEMARDAVLFGGTDPGRFCPTYMIFAESFLKPEQRHDPEFDRRDAYIITQNALADPRYLDYIRAHYQRSAQQDPPFFSELLRSNDERACEETNFLARMVRPLDRVFTNLGASVEQKRRAAGLYPPQELALPASADLDRAFSEYLRDRQERERRGQLRPGEELRVINGHAQITGQTAVMGINAVLTKSIFDRNPGREFYVEESFPLDWMYPHLTPFGTIMKLERQPPASLGAQVVERDRRFWRDYMERLIGDWVTPETNVAELCTFAEQVHMRKNLSGFRGDTAFLRDAWAQKGFSKLRNAIGGIYDWRFRDATGQLQQVSRELGQSGLSAAQAENLRAAHQRLTDEQVRMYREAEFAYKQAYALCPFSPEAVQRLVNLLAMAGRLSEALAVAEMSMKLDPGNAFFTNVAESLRHATRTQAQPTSGAKA